MQYSSALRRNSLQCGLSFSIVQVNHASCKAQGFGLILLPRNMVYSLFGKAGEFRLIVNNLSGYSSKQFV